MTRKRLIINLSIIFGIPSLIGLTFLGIYLITKAMDSSMSYATSYPHIEEGRYLLSESSSYYVTRYRTVLDPAVTANAYVDASYTLDEEVDQTSFTYPSVTKDGKNYEDQIVYFTFGEIKFDIHQIKDFKITSASRKGTFIEYASNYSLTLDDVHYDCGGAISYSKDSKGAINLHFTIDIPSTEGEENSAVIRLNYYQKIS